MTAKTDDGREVFRQRRIHMTQCTDSQGPVMVLGPDKKLGIVRDTAFQPFGPTRHSFEIALDREARELEVTVSLAYELRPGDALEVHRQRRRVSLAGLWPGR